MRDWILEIRNNPTKKVQHEGRLWIGDGENLEGLAVKLAEVACINRVYADEGLPLSVYIDPRYNRGEVTQMLDNFCKEVTNDETA